MLGTYLMTVMGGEWLKLGFAFLILVLLFFLVRKVDIHQMRIPSESSNSIFGFGTGLLTGLFTMNGVPPSIYLMYHQYPKEKYMANLVTFLIFSDLILVGVYLFKELFTLEGLVTSIKFAAMVILGFLIGSSLRRYVSSRTFKSIIIGFLAINSIKMIFEFFFL